MDKKLEELAFEKLKTLALFGKKAANWPKDSSQIMVNSIPSKTSYYKGQRVGYFTVTAMNRYEAKKNIVAKMWLPIENEISEEELNSVSLELQACSSENR